MHSAESRPLQPGRAEVWTAALRELSTETPRCIETVLPSEQDPAEGGPDFQLHVG